MRVVLLLLILILGMSFGMAQVSMMIFAPERCDNWFLGLIQYCVEP